MNSQSNADLLYWIATSHLLTIHTSKLLCWLKQRGDYQSLFSASVSDLETAGFLTTEIQKIKNIHWRAIEAEKQWYEKYADMITLKDPRYPALLKEITDPPLIIYVRGDARILSMPQIAIVGSRNPSPLGSETARQFAKTLVEKGFVITSGLASGIDSACHQGVLSTQGKTIAVMGTGMNQYYPRMHKSLAEKIRQQGVIVSEFPLNTPPSPWNFPRRNRIISGLSVGVLVVEAALRSGSLVTARCAMEQNREVFAIPGSIHHPLSRGCHKLIRQGAKLVESADDIIEEVGALASFIETQTQQQDGCSLREPLEAKHQALLQQIDYSATPLDRIILRCGLTASEVSSILLLLELKGYVQIISGGYIRI